MLTQNEVGGIGEDEDGRYFVKTASGNDELLEAFLTDWTERRLEKFIETNGLKANVVKYIAMY